jgi:H+-transporting ATPase
MVSLMNVRDATTTAAVTTGLSSEEAAKRLSEFGPNAVPEDHEMALRRIARHFWAPVPWMLEATVLLQLAVGERLEAALIAALLVFNVALGAFQEGRADAALALLKRHLSLKARVRRDGRWCELPATDLVPGDLIQLSLGTVVPADVRIAEGSILLDQSMLTGESVPADAGGGTIAYAGALVRRGEAIGAVTATGGATYFGRTAELVRVAHVESAELKAVLGLVRNLSVANAAIVVGLVAYAQAIALPAPQIIMLVLTAMLSAVPVALPATFTLAAALGAKALALKGVLLTRLSALHEAATIDVLCVDKTGTLTSNELRVTEIRPLADGWTAADLLAFAALASSADGGDPIDAAIREAAQATPTKRVLPTVIHFTPFDPANKRAQALARGTDGQEICICKGAPTAVAELTPPSAAAAAELDVLVRAGYRTLAIAGGEPEKLDLLGYVALSDPPRPDSAALLAQLRSLGVRTIMVTGDAAATAATVACAIGLDGRVCPAGKIPDRVAAEDFAIYAGVFPEDKFRLVRALQRAGHAVGMCGDGANDAPALRQAQMGIAVSTATDVAKSAAGIVLTSPGLGGIVTAVIEGRRVFQRVLTYTLTLLVNKCVTLAVLGAGLVLTGHAVLTPMLQAISMFAGDFVSMARTADHASPSPHPNAWRLRSLTIAAIPLASLKLLFCVSAIAMGAFRVGLSSAEMQTLTLTMLVFAGQGMVYVLRERRAIWSSRPSLVMGFFSLLDITAIASFAVFGILMPPLPLRIVFTLAAATVMFIMVLDRVKLMLFRRFRVD